MAYTKAQQEAFKNALLASGQPIEASTHREQVQKLIDEMYDAQSRGDILAGVQADSATAPGDTVLLIRSGVAYLVPASLFGGSGVNLADLGDVLIVDPQDEEILSYNAGLALWQNIPLTGLFVTQAQLDAALEALQLPEGARLISAELIITSTTAGTITAIWVDSLGETESVTTAPLTFNTLPGLELPGPGNFRFDIVQGDDAGAVDVKQGAEGTDASVAIPAADAGKVVLSVILWDDAGNSEVQQPGGGNTQQNDWQLLRQGTLLAPNTTGKFAKVWEGSLSKDANYSISLGYAEPRNAVNFDGSGFQILKLSFTCNSSRNIIADTVQVLTGSGSTAGEFVLYQIAANKAALYHVSNHYWGRIQYRVLFQNSQVRLQDFINAGSYGAAPTPVATYPSEVEGGGAAGYPEMIALESNTVLFDNDYSMGIESTARSGNVLFDFTGALRGASSVMRHNDGAAFTFPTENLIISGSYVASVDNYICFILVNKTVSSEVVLCTITQAV